MQHLGLDPELVTDLVARASRPDFDRLQHRLKGTGWCARPVRLRGHICDRNGDRVWSTAEEPDGVLRKACGNRREAVCPSCAERYRNDAFHLIAAGLNGGKGVPESVATHPLIFATLTAPSYGGVHTRTVEPDGQPRRCMPRRDQPTCEHGRPLYCNQVHGEDDECLGQPICSECFDRRAAVLSACWPVIPCVAGDCGRSSLAAPNRGGSLQTRRAKRAALELVENLFTD